MYVEIRTEMINLKNSVIEKSQRKYMYLNACELLGNCLCHSYMYLKAKANQVKTDKEKSKGKFK